MIRLPRSVLALLAAFLVAASLGAQPQNRPTPDPNRPISEPADPTVSRADYDRLLEWRFTAAAAPLPADGAGFTRGDATWRLESGSVRLQEPIAGGFVTGAVFEGTGRFHLPVREEVERDQVQRFAELTDDGAFDVRFDRLVLRVPGGAGELLGVDGADGPYERNDLAAERHERWLELLRLDVDARVLVGLLTEGSDYLLAAFETEEHGWLLYEHDPRRAEEGRLYRYRDLVLETWLSLDRVAAETEAVTDTLDVRHVDVRVDLVEPGRSPRAGITETHPRIGQFTAELLAEAKVTGTRVLRLTLRGDAEVEAVRIDGEDAVFLRNHIGERSAGIRDEVYDESLVVLLPEPLEEGEEVRIAADYRIEIYNYVRGRRWYPGEPTHDLEEVHTGSIELVLPRKIEARAMGHRESERMEGGERHERWVVDRPTSMLSFTIAERADSYALDVDDAPHIEVFGPGMGKEAKFHNVAADVANSVRFFEDLFDMPLDTEEILVASIVGGHGQSFYGFIHMAEGSFYLERPGASELFRAHEVAHQWWGHRVGWKTYRDQWLSEAFAEYSAMMYVQATMEDGEHWFEQILDTYTSEQNGSIANVLSKFARPGLAPLNPNHRAKMGPIGLGYRASASVAPGAYVVQTYQKGSLVLHMLRVMLRNLTKSDDLFVQVLSEFLHEYDGRAASTEDFVETLTRVAPGDWQWFFDQWIYGTAIPTYAWDWDVRRDRGGDSPYVLELTVRQEDVPAGFRMPVPVRIDFGRQGEGQAVVLVHQNRETFELPLPAKPKDVELNPGHAVLAKMEHL